MALERDVKPVPQDVLGVALVDSEAREFRLVDQYPSDVAPEEACKRAVRVRLLVRELMMPAVYGEPARGRFLEARHRDDHHGVLQPFRTFQAAMGQKPVIAKVDAKQPAQMGPEHGYDEATPAKIARQKSQQRRGMVGADHPYVGPVEAKRPHAGGPLQPLIRRGSNGMIHGGQRRGLYNGEVDYRHREVEIPISAPDAVCN